MPMTTQNALSEPVEEPPVRMLTARRAGLVAGLTMIAAVILLLFVIGVFGNNSVTPATPKSSPRATAQRFASAMVARDSRTVGGLICDPARAAAFARQLTQGTERTTVATLTGDPQLNGDTATQRVHYQVRIGAQEQNGDSEIVLDRHGDNWCVTDITAAGG